MVISLAKLSVLIRFTAGMNSDPLCKILSRSSIPFSPFPVARNFLTLLKFPFFGFFMSSASLFVWLPSRASSIGIASLDNNNCFDRYGGLPNYQQHLYICSPNSSYLWRILILPNFRIKEHTKTQRLSPSVFSYNSLISNSFQIFQNHSLLLQATKISTFLH